MDNKMFYLQSATDDTSVVDSNLKTNGPALKGKTPQSTDVTDQNELPVNSKGDWFSKAVHQCSSWKVLFQSIMSIPGFIAELYFGINYRSQCPIQPLINVFLIVHGCWSLTNGLMLFVSFITARCIKRSSRHSPIPACLFVASLVGQLVLFLFSVAWQIVGQVWVFGAQKNDFQSNDATQSSTYCYPMVFWSGFITIIVTYVTWLILPLILVGRWLIKRRKSKQTMISFGSHR